LHLVKVMLARPAAASCSCCEPLSLLQQLNGLRTAVHCNGLSVDCDPIACASNTMSEMHLNGPRAAAHCNGCSIDCDPIACASNTISETNGGRQEMRRGARRSGSYDSPRTHGYDALPHRRCSGRPRYRRTLGRPPHGPLLGGRDPAVHGSGEGADAADAGRRAGARGHLRRRRRSCRRRG